MRRILILLVGFGLAGPPALAVHFYLTPDVPADLTLAGTTLPWHVARGNTATGTYEPALSLPFGTAVDGLHQLPSGDWLLSVEVPTDLGGSTHAPQDVILHDPDTGTFTPFFCGVSAGLPIEANMDALFLEGGDEFSMTSTLVMSFDAPATIGVETFDSADLASFARTGLGCADWAFGAIYFDASAASPPVPPSSDVTAADRRAGRLILSFDIPTTIGGETFLPGELTSWVPCPSGGGSGSDTCISAWFLAGEFYQDPAWPLGARLDSFSFLTVPLGDPGRIPPTLQVNPGAPDGSTLVLSWEPSCSAGAEDYCIYAGEIGNWYSHVALDCTDDGTPFTETVATSPINTYYLVVPCNPDAEGSYGTNSAGAELPPGAAACVPAQTLPACL